MTISRRAVLSLSAATVLAPLGDTIAWSGPLHCVVVENGTPGSAGYTVSMLTCHDLAGETAALERLRVAQNYHRQNFSYRSTDRRKVPYFQAVMDRFAQSPDVMAYSVRADGNANVRFEAYRKLFAMLPASERPTASIHLAPRTSDAREVRLSAHLQKMLGRQAQIAVDGAANGEMMAFAAVLFGSIKLAQDNSGARVSKTKAKIVEAAQHALRVPDLAYETLARTGKFVTAVG